MKPIIHLIKYTFISGFTLSVDLLSFQLLSKVSFLSIPMASTLSYCIGLSLAYVIFINSIFIGTKYTKHKKLQLLLFGISGVIGVVTTFFISTISHHLLEGSRWESKMSAVFCSFFIVYWYRNRYVFANVE
jgi:putative flippase GtrA